MYKKNKKNKKGVGLDKMNDYEFEAEPRFKPHYFGGYTLMLLLTGMFTGLAFSGVWYLALIGIPLYVGALYFYAKNKKEFVKDGKN